MGLNTEEDGVSLQVLFDFLTKIKGVSSIHMLVTMTQKAIDSKSEEDADEVWFNLYEKFEDWGDEFDLWVLDVYEQ
jgi:hypothetical protein